MKKLSVILAGLLLAFSAPAQWVQQVSGTSQFLNCIFFTDSLSGHAAGDSGTILQTSNGGTTWEQEFSGTDKPLKSIVFTGTETGYVAGGK